MHEARRRLYASLFVVGAGAAWGLYWIPVHALSAAGFGGALGSLMIAAIAVALLAPVIARRRLAWAQADRLGIAATALGGSAFMLYSVGLVAAPVAIVILLFYLTPVWTTVIARLCFSEAIPPLRYVVIVLGLAGLDLILDPRGILPVPHRVGAWLGLLSGLFWSLASLGMNRRSDLPATESAFVFVLGALATAAVLFVVPIISAQTAGSLPSLATIGWALAAAALWWIVPMIGLARATAYIEPARIGLLMMSEVLTGVLSAALFAGETLTPMQIIGAVILVGAAGLDVISDLRRHPTGP